MGYRYTRTKKSAQGNSGTDMEMPIERIRKARALNCSPYSIGMDSSIFRKSNFGRCNNEIMKNW